MPPPCNTTGAYDMQRREARLDGCTLAYMRIGQGMPLLCLHGGMGVDSGTLRVPGILNLGKHGCEVILVDQRGHGFSSTSKPSEYTHEVWAADVHRLAQHLGWEKFTLLGHSYGGFIALEYAVRWPQTLARLILVSTSAGPVSFVPAACDSPKDVHEFYAKRWPSVIAGADKHWEVLEQSRFSPVPFNAAFERELPRYDLRDKVHRLTSPTLLVVGEEDHYKQDMEWLAQTLPNARLCVLPGVGHLPFVEDENGFVKAVCSFMDGT